MDSYILYYLRYREYVRRCRAKDMPEDSFQEWVEEILSLEMEAKKQMLLESFNHDLDKEK